MVRVGDLLIMDEASAKELMNDEIRKTENDRKRLKLKKKGQILNELSTLEAREERNESEAKKLKEDIKELKARLAKFEEEGVSDDTPGTSLSTPAAESTSRPKKKARSSRRRTKAS